MKNRIFNMSKEKKSNQDKIEKETEINEQDSQSIEKDLESESTEKVEDLGQKLIEMNDKYLRLYSDFENYRKRTSKEKLDMIKFASEDTIKDLLPIIDDYERAMEDIDNQDISDTTKEGLRLIYSKLMNTLTQKGVKPINAKGELFDENIHEAVTQIPAQCNEDKGRVIDEITKGYFMFDKVIRFSKVVVAI
ncbi:MAG: nucleotide exchange factor GrpE [Bacteroidales bacterium]|jgi:molecular chaperone GrpE|nr:nucleotide exchange factor GrpE [Bacteroidales bacterium]